MLGQLLRDAAARAPDAVAFVDGDRRLTYSEWDWLSDRAARALADEGMRARDVVALLLQPSIHYPIAYLGAAKIGCITVGINPRLARPEVDAILEHSGARALVADDPAPGVITPAQLNQPAAAPPENAIEPTSPVAIVYTSGTTGTPKGATFTYAALEAIRRIEAAVDATPHPVSLQSIPLAHMQFMTKIASFIDRLGTSVLLARWTPKHALDAIERERVTAFGGVPTQLAMMLADPTFASRDLSSVRSVTLGGAPAEPELIARIRERFSVPVIVRYSSTELALCTATRADDPIDVVAQTVGRPLPEVDVTIDRAGDDGIGEVCARSPAMMAGYWRAQDTGIDPSGYFHTGDLGRLREDGNLTLVGRAKDMYIRAGYNIYPVEVENALRAHPRVAQAAVVAVPDAVLGEKGVAFVVPRNPADPPPPDALLEHLTARIAGFKLPDAVEIRPELPLTPMFKVDKRALAEEAARAASKP